MIIKKNQIWQSRLHPDIKLLIISVSKTNIKALIQSDISDNGQIKDYIPETFEDWYKLTADTKENSFSRVIFKTEKGSKTDVVAFLLDVPSNYGNVVCYAHVGQHGEASLEYARECKPARPDQYANLWKELTSSPYTYFLQIVHKFPSGFTQGGKE